MARLSAVPSTIVTGAGVVRGRAPPCEAATPEIATVTAAARASGAVRQSLLILCLLGIPGHRGMLDDRAFPGGPCYLVRLMVQPKALVSGRAGDRPASTASSASRRS